MTTSASTNKTLRYSLISLLFSMCSFASADIALKLSDDTSLLALNGQSVIERNDLVKKGILRLQNGTHQILVNHSVVIGEKFEDEEFHKTEVFALVFNSSNQKLALVAPKFKQVSDIDKFNKAPSWKIIDQSGKAIDLKISVLKKDGLQLSRNYDHELNLFNAQNEAASLASLSTIPSHIAKRKVTASPEPATPVTSVEKRAAHNPTEVKPAAKVAPQIQTSVKPSVTTKAKTTPAVKTTPAAQTYGISSRTLIELYQQASPASQQEFIEWLNQP